MAFVFQLERDGIEILQIMTVQDFSVPRMTATARRNSDIDVSREYFLLCEN